MKEKVCFVFVIVLIMFTSGTNVYAQQFGKGLLFDDASYAQMPKKAILTYKSYAAVPSSASLEQYCPQAGDQGMHGTCVGWSTAWAARTILYAANNNITDKSRITQKAFSPSYVYYFAKGDENDTNCENGARFKPALELLKINGVPRYSDLPDMCASDIPDDIIEKASDYNIKDYNRIFDPNSSNDDKVNATKKALANKMPVLIGMICPPSLSYVSSSSPIWKPTESPNPSYGGHAICVVGYDDDKYGGAFEILNSWGSDYADDGFFWVGYNDYADFTKYGFELYADKKEVVEKEISLSGNVVFQLSTGEKLTTSVNKKYNTKGQTVVADIDENNNVADYIINKPLSSGSKYRIYLGNSEPAYVYVISSDLKNNTSVLFPHNSNVSPYLNYTSTEIALPGEQYSIRLDNNTGIDYTCILYSNEALDIDAIMSEIKSSGGSFNEKINNAVGAKLIPKNKIQLSNSKVSFQAKSKDKSVVAIIVQIKHT